ncbi:MAG: hypothetical protein ACYC6C_10715 [Coriobacteriia bacterium]
MHDQLEPEQEIPAEENLPDEYAAREGAGPEVEAVEHMTLSESGSSEDAEADVEPAPVPEPAAEPESAAEIEPEVVEAAVITTGDMPAGNAARVAWWPFLLLVGSWVALAGTAAYVLTRTSDVPAFRHEYYPFIVLAGVVLTALGPVLAIIAWVLSPKDSERGGQFITSFVRAAAITLFGVLMWWGVLVAVDAFRLGLIRL